MNKKLIKELIKEKKSLKEKLEEIDKKLFAERSTFTVKCVGEPWEKGCGAETEIKDVQFIRHEYYVAPYGCIGGDYWTIDEKQGGFVCPSCGKTNRLNRLYGNEEALKLRHLFKQPELVEYHK